jgi:hypothetical protein
MQKHDDFDFGGAFNNFKVLTNNKSLTENELQKKNRSKEIKSLHEMEIEKATEEARTLASHLDTRRGFIAHAHIAPAFSRRVPFYPYSKQKSDATEEANKNTSAEERAISEDRKRGVELGLLPSHILRTNQYASNSSAKSSNSVETRDHQNVHIKRPPRNEHIPWIKELSVTLQTQTNPSGLKSFPIRFTLHKNPIQSLKTSNVNSEVPENTDSLLLTLTSPTTDAFFHYSFHIHAFSISSFMRRQGWDHEKASKLVKGIDGIGSIIKDRVRDCLLRPDR